MPDGLENSDIKENVSPMIGHPVVPGIFLISGEDAHERNHMKHDAMRVERRTSIGKVPRNSIENWRLKRSAGNQEGLVCGF